MNVKKILNAEFIKTNKKTFICFVVGLLGILLIFASEAFGNTSKKSTKSSEKTYVSYSNEMEEKLADIISKVDGAGKTKVFLTIEESEEYVYAQDISSDRKDNTQENENKEYVIVDSDKGKGGLLIKTVNPKIRGVAIVCEGGDDPVVQQRIYSCVSASLGISTARISISKMTSMEVKNEK